MSLAQITRELQALLEPREEAGFFARLWGLQQEPATVAAAALGELMKQLAPSARASDHVPTRGPGLVPHFDAACRELLANVRAVRALSEERPHPPFAYVTWLWKVLQVLQTLEHDGWLEAAPRPSATPRAAPKPLSWLLKLPVEPLLPPLPMGERLRGLALAPLLELASRETERLGRRRRLLEAARRVLLESAAATPAPQAEVQARAVAISEQIRRINQWQAEGLDPDVDLSHQLLRAVKRRDARGTQGLLAAADQLTRGSPRASRLGERVGQARFLAQQRLGATEAPSAEQLCRDTFGDTAAGALIRGVARAPDLMPDALGEIVRVGSAVDGSFELGRSVAPVRAIEEQRRMAVVDFPTQTMVLAPARRVSELATALIGDPRLIVYELASRTLLSRRYLAQRTRRVSTAPRFNEARYYLLDGSASMGGRRGRMRDAILIAELSMLIRHLEQGNAAARPIVYYRFFSKGSEPLRKISSIEDATAAIELIWQRKSRGETDIERVLLESFAELSVERERDATLKRAQLVLVSDGVAKIDIERVWAARQQLGDMPVSVSVIALGGENPALRQLAALQRARGEAVFYHYLADDALYQLSRGGSAKRAPLAPAAFPTPGKAAAPAATPESRPKRQEPSPVVEDPELWQELDRLVDELVVLQAPPDLDEVLRAEQLGAAFDELGMSLDDTGLEAEKARYEAKRRDARALAYRFDHWFPEPSRLRAEQLPPPPELVEVLEVTLLSVLELVSYLDGAPLQRRVDAIELLERLLVEAGVAPWSYCRALPFASERARAAITELRTLVGARDADAA